MIEMLLSDCEAMNCLACILHDNQVYLFGHSSKMYN